MFFCDIKVELYYWDYYFVDDERDNKSEIFSHSDNDFMMMFLVIPKSEPLEFEYIHSAKKVIHFIVLESFHGDKITHHLHEDKLVIASYQFFRYYLF